MVNGQAGMLQPQTRTGLHSTIDPLPALLPTGQEGIEPPTAGFGDRCSTN